MNLPFILPPVTDEGSAPIWMGNGFCIGNDFFKVLQYSSNKLGWTDELTYLHEESAGETHFIDCATRDYVIQEFKKYLSNRPATLLEIGCSSGFMLQRLRKEFPSATLVGADIVHEPLLKLADELPNVPLLRFDLLQCPLPDNSIDAIVMLNVLEHIEEDHKALAQLYRTLKPGGILALVVPAGPHLFDIYDQLLLHYRRYSLTDLTRLAKQQGFKVMKQSHLGFFLYPAFWLVKKYNQYQYPLSHSSNMQILEKNNLKTRENKLLDLLTQFELKLGKMISYPFGIRCLLTCIK